jgi:hypothetical protein
MWKLVGVAALLALLVVIVRLATRPSTMARHEPSTPTEERAESAELAGAPTRAIEAAAVDERAPVATAATIPAPDSSALVIRVLENGEPAATDVWVSEAGAHSLTFELLRLSPVSERQQISFWNEAPAVLDVLDGAGPQVFRVDAPSPEVVREMSAYIEESE